MFETFTRQARQVVVRAQKEASLLDCHYVGTEHLLLGLICESEGSAAAALKRLGVSPQDVQREVQSIGGGGRLSEGHIPFSLGAKRALDLSSEESARLGHHYVGSGHIMLALIRERDDLATQVLVRRGINLDLACQEVIRLLLDRSGEVPPTGGADPHEAE